MGDSKPSEGKNNNGTSERSAFLKCLFEYRDIVLLVFIVISGFLWLYNFFATQKQLKSLTCILQQSAYQDVIKLERRLKYDEYKLAQIRQGVLTYMKENNLGFDMRELEEIRVKVKNLDEDINNLDEEIDESTKKIIKEEC